MFSILECTIAAMTNIITRQSLPFWWDDAYKFSVLEDLAVMAFNKVRLFISVTP